MLPIVAVVPIRIESLNKTYSDNWRKRANRNTTHRLAVYAMLRKAAGKPSSPDLLPCVVTLTRIAPRLIDQHDNLRAGFKSAVDAVADWLDVDDADPRVTWLYAQERGKPNEYLARVEIAARP